MILEVNRKIESYGAFYKEKEALIRLLTKQEKRILFEIVKGNSTTEIAEQLFISTETVRWHKKCFKKKLQTNSPYDIYRIGVIMYLNHEL